jgi:hypothetical protein
MRTKLAKICSHLPGKYPDGSGRKSQATAKAIDNVPWEDSKHKQQFPFVEKETVEWDVYYQNSGEKSERDGRKQRLQDPGHKQAYGQEYQGYAKAV